MVPEPAFHKRVHWKILGVFFQNPSREYSFSDLLRITTAGPTNIKKALDELGRKGIFTPRKEGHRILYRLDLDNYLVRSLFFFRAWERVQEFPVKVRKALQKLVEKVLPHQVCSVYIFGSSVLRATPQDIDVAIVYTKNRKELEQVWLEVMVDFEENVEGHFFEQKEFVELYQQGDYRITSTLSSCLVLSDNDFLFSYLKSLSLPSKKFLERQVKEIERKIVKAFQLYRDREKESEDLVDGIFNEFLRIYIAYKKEIPGSKHLLRRQARQLGLSFPKRTLWETLEWMKKTLREIKMNL